MNILQLFLKNISYAYDKKNLVGNVLDSQKDTGEWIDIERGSIGEKFLKAIC